MGIHINPFKKKKILSYNEGKPQVTEEPMSWEDAAKIALIITIAQIFGAFLTLYDWSKIVNNPEIFLFDLFKFAGASFFTTFIALTGLAKYFSN